MDTNLLAVYRDHPMRDGDVVLLLDDLQLANEIEGLADHWGPVVRRNIARVLREVGTQEVHLAIARVEGLLDSDHVLEADLREELHGSGILLHPVVALPAA